eukprot:2351926-Ditylum_brightwellii.AAC.1
MDSGGKGVFCGAEGVFVRLGGEVMGCDEGSVALLKQGSESSNTLHEPGLVAFLVSEEEGLFHLNDGG